MKSFIKIPEEIINGVKEYPFMPGIYCYLSEVKGQTSIGISVAEILEWLNYKSLYRKVKNNKETPPTLIINTLNHLQDMGYISGFNSEDCGGRQLCRLKYNPELFNPKTKFVLVYNEEIEKVRQYSEGHNSTIKAINVLVFIKSKLNMKKNPKCLAIKLTSIAEEINLSNSLVNNLLVYLTEASIIDIIELPKFKSQGIVRQRPLFITYPLGYEENYNPNQELFNKIKEYEQYAQKTTVSDVYIDELLLFSKKISRK